MVYFGLTDRRLAYSTVILFLAATTAVLQFSSTLLLSDLHLGPLPSLSYPNKPYYDFAYALDGDAALNAAFGSSAYPYPLQLRTSTWLRPAPAFPSFAEYAAPVPSQEGVDDTGVLLRAFLPFADAETRETIRNYTGTAFVLDSRVSCQRPKLSRLRLTRTSNSNDSLVSSHYPAKLTGRLQPSFADVDRLWTPGPVAFECGVLIRPEALSLCQISTMYPMYDSYSNNGGLLSEFWNLTLDETTQAVESGHSMWSLPMIVVQPSAISSQAMSTEIRDVKSNGVWTDIITEHQTWSISVCYSAWATADLNVDIHSDSTRKEPTIHWNDQQGYHTVPDVHMQMGEIDSSAADPSTRGILQLARKESWFPSEQNTPIIGIQPFVQEFVDVTNDLLTLCSNPPCSALLPPGGDQSAAFYLHYVYNVNRAWTGMFPADLLASSLFHQTLDANNGTGSLARAMSTLITTLSSMAYYDQMPQFAQSSNASQISFTKVLFPQSRLGFCVVIGCLAVHMTLILLVTVAFGLYSKHTLLGNHWQSIAQLRGPETDKLITRTNSSTDGEVKKIIASSGQEDISVSIRPTHRGDISGLRLIRNHKFNDDLS